MSNVFAISALSGLSQPELETVNKLCRQLEVCAPKNAIKEAYYSGYQRVRDLGIAIPPSLRDVEVVVGWPGTTVDVLDERINLISFTETGGHDYGVKEIATANRLVQEAPQGHVDALIYGVSFMVVGTGQEGEPAELITYESPMSTTGEYSLRARGLTSLLTWEWDAEASRPKRVTLYLPDQTIVASRQANETTWRVEDRDEHQLGRVPAVRLVNRPRSSNKLGRSEITRPIRTYTDNAVRTLLGMEVAREFYGAPQRWLMGANEEAFVGPDGNRKTVWESYLGRMLAIGVYEDDEGNVIKPEAGQFPAASMTPYGDQIRLLSGMVAAESGFPATYLGFITDNPPSADSIRALEARLIKRAERRITASFRPAEVEALEIGVRIRTGSWPEAGAIHALYSDPATPTQAATTDAVVKQVQANILPARSSVALRRLGYTEEEIAEIQEDASASELDRAIAQATAGQIPTS